MARIDGSSPHSNSPSCEILGIYLALPLQRAHPDLYIFSDCLRALAVAQYLQWSTKLAWIPSKLNPADTIAKYAGRSNLDPIPRSTTLPLTREVTRATLLNLADMEARERWRKVLPKLGLTINGLLSNFPTLQHLSPHLSSSSFRCIQGHNCFPRANSLRGHTPSSSCLFCHSPDANALQMALDCPKSADLRRAYFGRSILTGEIFQQITATHPKSVGLYLHLLPPSNGRLPDLLLRPVKTGCPLNYQKQASNWATCQLSPQSLAPPPSPRASENRLPP